MRLPTRSLKSLRRGTVAPLVVFSLTTLLAILALAVNKSWLWSVREELKASGDAAALAAAQELVDDDMLRGNEQLYPPLLERSANRAISYASINRVRNNPLVLLDNVTNAAGGDILFGVLSRPRAGDFIPVPSRESADADQGRTNTVVITSRQVQSRGTAPGLIFGIFAAHSHADVIATTAATLDRGIRGFRPRGTPTPLAPFALFSESTATDPRSWESQVENGVGPDLVRFDRTTNSFVPEPAGDGIREFVVAFATHPAHLPAANATLLHLGASDIGEIAAQLTTGVSATELANFGGSLILPENGPMTIGGQPIGPAGDSPEILPLYLALEQLRQSAAVRIWPLYSSAGLASVEVSGFVAARVTTVTPPAPDTPLTFTLQATFIHRTDAVTDTDLRGSQATMNNNRYLCKIRRVE